MPTIPISAPRTVPRRAGLAALACVAAALAACGGGGDDRQAPASVSAVVGAAGGSIRGPDGVQLIVPAGALLQDTTITIARTGDGAPALPGDYPPAGPMVEITPHDLAFQVPVTLRIPMAGQGDVADALVASPADGWSPAQAGVQDGFAEFTRLSLSWYQPFVCAVPVPNPDPYACVYARANTTLATVPAGGALALVHAASAQSRWSLAQATTLRVTTTYSAAPDCLSPHLQVERRGGGAAPVDLYDQPVPMSPINSVRHGGTVGFDLEVTPADDGLLVLKTTFTCERPGRGIHRDGYAHFVAVDVPAAAAPPTLTQSPTDLTVTAGQPAAFTVAASAPDALSIGWQQSVDGGITYSTLPDTGPTLTLATTAVADDGKRLRARVCNSAAGRSDTCLTSAAARLTVQAAATVAPTWGSPATLGSGSLEDAAAGMDGTGRSLAVWPASSRMVASRGTATGAWVGPTFIDNGLPGGAGSFEPQLGVASGGSAVAVWGYLASSRFGIAANRFDGTSWGTAEILDDGNGGPTSEHRVAVDGSGRAVAAWELGTTVQVRIHDGSGWTPAVALGAPGDQPQVALDPQGRGFVTYVEGGSIRAAAVDAAAGTVGTPVVVASGRSFGDHRLAVDAAGGAVLVWVEDMVSGGYDIRSSRFDGSSWTAAQTLAVDVPFNRELAVAAGGAGAAVAAWLGRDANGDDTVFARRLLPAGGWEAASARSDAGAENVEAVQVAMSPGGRIVLAWAQADLDFDPQAWARVYDGGWGAAQAVQASADPLRVPRVPLPVRGLAIGGDGQALLVWLETGSTVRLQGAYLR